MQERGREAGASMPDILISMGRHADGDSRMAVNMARSNWCAARPICGEFMREACAALHILEPDVKTCDYFPDISACCFLT